MGRRSMMPQRSVRIVLRGVGRTARHLPLPPLPTSSSVLQEEALRVLRCGVNVCQASRSAIIRAIP